MCDLDDDKEEGDENDVVDDGFQLTDNNATPSMSMPGAAPDSFAHTIVFTLTNLNSAPLPFAPGHLIPSTFVNTMAATGKSPRMVQYNKDQSHKPWN